MSVSMKSVLAITAMLAVWATEARGQINLPFGPENYDQDLRIFAPLELDLDNLPADDGDCGYFFGYEKLYWSYTGERTTIGNPEVVAFAEEIYLQNPQDQGVRPDPHQIYNSLTSVPPAAGFSGGDRYEFGYRDRDNGWYVSVLKGPDLYEHGHYGFGATNPTIDIDYTDSTDVQNDPGPPDGAPSGTVAGGELRAFGFGSVPVLFDAPAGYLWGFRDYLQYLGESALGTVAGPLLYVGNYSMPSATDTDPGDQTITYFRVADDLDGDANPGVGFITDADGNIIMTFHDYDDLSQFNVYFDEVTVLSHVKTDGVEMMWTHELSNQNYMARRQNNRLQLSAGARYFRFLDEFTVDAVGSFLGDSLWDTAFDNQIVGPQVGLRWTNQRERWTINTDAKFTFGYNVQDWSQTAAMGSHLIPGALNRPLYGRPTYSQTGVQMEDFSPVAELRVEASYHLTKAFALKVGYNGMFVGNVRRAGNSVKYYLPTMGFNDAGTQNLVVNGFNVGLEFVH